MFEKKVLGLMMLLLPVVSCQQVEIIEESQSDGPCELIISGAIGQNNLTRVDANGFETGDRMGIYVVDYEGGSPGSLAASDNRATNMLYTYNAENTTWSSPTPIYWKDSSTPIDIYGYYPGVRHIENPGEYSFDVSYMQNVIPSDGSMSAYEASDFMWAKAGNVSYTTETITLQYSHRMACVEVTLNKEGTGINDDEWQNKQVQVDNVRRHATIDLATGIATPVGEVDRSVLMRPLSDNVFRAVVVPQEVPANTNRLTITIGGVAYKLGPSSDAFTYEMGKLYRHTITVQKKESTEGYTLSVSNQEIQDWENDATNYPGYESNSYVTINVPAAGGLKQIISDKKLTPSGIKNLKLTGSLNAEDFNYIRTNMTDLVRINMESVKIRQVESCTYWDCDRKQEVKETLDDYLPNRALKEMRWLRQVILPQSLKHIGEEALSNLTLTSPLIIPEGVTHLHTGACSSNADIILPHSLEYIGNSAFYGSGPRVELVMTDNLRYIGNKAFFDGSGVTGTFYLSPNLEYLGEKAFWGCGRNLTGDIVIPSNITTIPAGVFYQMGFAKGTNVIMHDAVTKIGDSAFASTRIRNEIDWPENLMYIEKNAFYDCQMILSEFVFPKKLRKIANGSFWNNRIGGTLVITDNFSIIEGAFNTTSITELITGNGLMQIAKEAFQNCALQKVTLGKNIDYIGQNSFSGNRNMQVLICLAEEPPVVYGDSFNDIPFDKCVLQVPEKSVDKYRNTSGWDRFKNITVYKELAFNIPSIITLNKGGVREGVIRAEGPWQVTDCPDWVIVTPMQGEGKAEVTVTVKSQDVGSSTREGQIIFSLTGTEYTTYTDVRQEGGQIGEDQIVVLKNAGEGVEKPIPLFIVGDGYNASDVVSGKYLDDITQQMEYFFSIEPLKSYKDYFKVSTAYAVSPESGINGLTKFDSEYYGDLHGNDNKLIDYAEACGVLTDGNKAHATILVLLNTEVTANSTTMYDNGLAISWMGKSKDSYPYDQKGFVLHEFAGKAFGKLGPETINHLTFLDACGCPGCNMLNEYERAQRNGWWKNVSRTNKLKSLPWYHLMFHEKYSSIVDVFEGGMNHSRGAYRSESQSVMGNAHIHYFNTISRELLVRRIMECAGETFVFNDFVTKDKIEIPE